MWDTYPSGAVLKDDVHVGVVLEVVVKADDVAVAQVPVDLDLASDLCKRKEKYVSGRSSDSMSNSYRLSRII